MKFPLFETLAVREGIVQNILYHQARYKRALQIYYPKQRIKIWDFTSIIEVPETYAKGLVRLRIDYNNESYQLSFYPYQPKVIRSFKRVYCDDIDYALKYADRTLLNRLYEQRGMSEEIIIIKNGYVTDCTVGNLIFFKEGCWYTPNTPLLEGTQRAQLLSEKKIISTEITDTSIFQYEKIKCINALNPFPLASSIFICKHTIE